MNKETIKKFIFKNIKVIIAGLGGAAFAGLVMYNKVQREQSESVTNLVFEDETLTYYVNERTGELKLFALDFTKK